MLAIWGCLLSAGKPIQAPLFPLVLGLLLFAPIGAVGSMGPALSRLRPFWIEHRAGMTFLAVRPMEGSSFVAAKMRMVLVTVLVSWVLILGGTALCIWLTKSMPAAITNWRRFETLYPGGRAPLICVLVCALMPVLKWRLLTDGLPFVLTGRKWVADSAVLLYFAVLVSLVSGGVWLGNHQEHLPRVIAIASWLVGALALLKASSAAVAFHFAMRRGFFGWAAVGRIFGSWVAITGLACALVILLDPPSALVSKPAMFLGIATAVPLVRLPLTALAFDWNRHR
jgi:hypothetical protein